MYEKPLPIVDPDTLPYWEALREHRLILKHCKTCEQSHFYPRELCPFCHGFDLSWKNASGKASVYSYTVARRPAGPAFKADVPYVIALVELAEGPRMLTQLVGLHPDAVRIGMHVQVVFDAVTADIALPKFEAAGLP